MVSMDFLTALTLFTVVVVIFGIIDTKVVHKSEMRDYEYKEKLLDISRQQKVQFCPECGSKNSMDASFCNECGSPLLHNN